MSSYLDVTCHPEWEAAHGARFTGRQLRGQSAPHPQSSLGPDRRTGSTAPLPEPRSRLPTRPGRTRPRTGFSVRPRRGLGNSGLTLLLKAPWSWAARPSLLRLTTMCNVLIGKEGWSPSTSRLSPLPSLPDVRSVRQVPTAILLPLRDFLGKAGSKDTSSHSRSRGDAVISCKRNSRCAFGVRGGGRGPMRLLISGFQVCDCWAVGMRCLIGLLRCSLVQIGGPREVLTTGLGLEGTAASTW